MSFLDEGVFRVIKYNSYDPENDYNFMLQMFKQRLESTRRQQSKINVIIMNSIILYIRKMVLDNYEKGKIYLFLFKY